MKPLHVLLSSGTERPPAHRQLLLLCAALMAVFLLLALYVNLLHEAMARGDQMREEQRSSAGRATVNVAVPQMQVGLTIPQNAAGAADLRRR